MTERRACRVLSVNKAAYRYDPVVLSDEERIRTEVIEKACNYGRVGYRMVTNMMRNSGVNINHKRVERIWREEGLKLPQKQIKNADYGLLTVVASGYDRNIGIMSGVTIL